MSKEHFEKIEDELLVYKIVKTNNQHLFGILYDRYADRIYNKCLGFVDETEEAQDMTHDIFLKLYVKLKSFKGESKFSTWVYSFTYNFCINHIQRKYNKNKKHLSEETISDEIIEDIDDKEIFELKIEKLNQSIKQLNVEDKTILLMKYQDDFSIKDIANTLEIGESATKMRLNRAKSRLIKLYNSL